MIFVVQISHSRLISIANVILKMNHGAPTSSTRHVGDLGNIVSTTTSGITTVSLTDSVISLKDGNVANILNRAIVIHANADTFTDASSAGDRISCGIIEECDSNCQHIFGIERKTTYKFYNFP